MKKHIFSFLSALTVLTVLLAVLPGAGAQASSSADPNVLSNYTLYSADGTLMTQSGSSIVSTGSGEEKAILNNATVSDFKADVTLKLDENGYAFCGVLFRIQRAGNAQDDIEGYEILFERMKAEGNTGRIDISLQKFGKKSASAANAIYLGQIARATDEQESSILKPYGDAANQEIHLHIDVIGKQVRAYCYVGDKPEIQSVCLNGNLDNTPANDKLKNYYASGSIGLIANSGKGKVAANTFSGFSFSKLSAVTEGSFNKFDDFYYFSDDTKGGIYQKGSVFAVPGSAFHKAVVRNLYLVGDLDASVDLGRDPDGNIQGGLMFHATDISQWNEKLSGYSIYVQSFAADKSKIEVMMFKYGEDLTGTCAWLGVISPTNLKTSTFVSEGKGSLADGINNWVLKVKTVGDVVSAQLISKDGKKFSPILTYNKTDAAVGGSTDVNKQVFKEGNVGIILKMGTFDTVKVGGKFVGVMRTPLNLVLILSVAGGAVVLIAVVLLLLLLRRKKKKKGLPAPSDAPAPAQPIA